MQDDTTQQSQSYPQYPQYSPYSQLPVATAMQPPAVMPSMPPTMPPAMAPGPGSGWRLGALVAVVVVLVIAIAGTQAAALAATRSGAYPRPAVNISLASSGPYRVGNAVQFAVNATAGRALTYEWGFGDDQGASGTSVTHTYSSYGTFAVTVRATDPIGQSAIAQQQINVLPPPPQACFTDTPDAQDPLFIAFDASCSTGAQLSYSWQFGDGESSTDGPQTEHEFQLGTYTVTLTVTDIASQTATTSNSVTVSIPAPQASFTDQQTSNDGFYACYDFDGTASTGYQLSYNWNFGNGDVGFGSTESDCFYTGSSYTVTLTVTDGLGRSDSTSSRISV